MFEQIRPLESVEIEKKAEEAETLPNDFRDSLMILICNLNILKENFEKKCNHVFDIQIIIEKITQLTLREITKHAGFTGIINNMLLNNMLLMLDEINELVKESLEIKNPDFSQKKIALALKKYEEFSTQFDLMQNLTNRFASA